MTGILPRRAQLLLERSLASSPAIMLVGPRAVGKTTLGRQVTRSLVRLDEPGVATVFRAAPDVALASVEEPALLDEWQAVPEVLGAVKRAVDDEWRPGRFVLAGSVRARSSTATWPGTGRVITLPLFGLSMAERTERIDQAPFLDRMSAGVSSAGGPPLDLGDYVDLALSGTLPQSVAAPSSGARRQFLTSYLRDVVERDALELEARRNPLGLRRFLAAWAGLSGSVATDQTVFRLADVNRATGLAYERLLADLFVIDQLPAWHSNRLERLTSMPKRLVLDAGLMSAALGVDRAAVLTDGTLLGKVLETFVIAELRAELAVAEGEPTLFHLRDDAGRHEVDVIVEYADGRVVALEIKATNAPKPDDAKHLVWLKERLGDRLIASAVLHSGPLRFPLLPGVDAIPISEIWA